MLWNIEKFRNGIDQFKIVKDMQSCHIPNLQVGLIWCLFWWFAFFQNSMRDFVPSFRKHLTILKLNWTIKIIKNVQSRHAPNLQANLWGELVSQTALWCLPLHKGASLLQKRMMNDEENFLREVIVKMKRLRKKI